MCRKRAFHRGAAQSCGAALSALLLLLASPVAAQDIARRVAGAPDGVVRMSIPARPGVCGSGANILVRDTEREGRTTVLRGTFAQGQDPDLESGCEAGPVRVELRVRGGEVTDIRSRVGSFAPAAGPVADLGTVAARDAVDYLIALAARAPAKAGRDALLPVVLADAGSVWPQLLRLAATAGAPEKVRESAIFWAAQQGAPVDELRRLYARTPERELREQILFAYHRQEDPEATRELLRVARGEDDRKLRKTAVFWLGQAAGRAVTRDLAELVEDGSADAEVREHAIFALSRRPRDEAVPALIHVARTNPDARLRKRALFWLGQTGDPRALDLFEEILGGS